MTRSAVESLQTEIVQINKFGNEMKTILCTILLAFGIVASAQDITQSHIDANVPGQADFDKLLNRDLKRYLTERYKQTTTVRYEMLRDGPTQTGIAYPKFYIWVVALSDNDTVITEGVIRLAAVDEKEFRITDYITKDEIRGNPKVLDAIFPAALISRIKIQAGIQD